jgi:short-subunit dehydrogenase
LSWAGRGITVCQLNPGFIETEGFTQAQIKRTPLGRLVGQPEDVARRSTRSCLTARVERTVPGWYRTFVVARHVAAPLYRSVAGRLARASGTRD